MPRINGLSFTAHLEGAEITAHKFSLEITDNTAVAKKNGLPNGVLLGDVEASGTITLDADDFAKIKALAVKAGSYQAISALDFMGYAKVDNVECKVEAFGCKLALGSVLDVDKTSTDEYMREISFNVTDPEFVRIDGVPYKVSS